MKFDQAFTIETLKRVIRKSDFARETESTPLEKDLAIDEAVKSANDELMNNSLLQKFHILNRNMWRYPKLSDQLILRKLARNIRKVLGLRTVSRNDMMHSLRAILSEGVPYRVYRLDMSKFYESICTDALMSQLDRVPDLSPLSKELTRSFLKSCRTAGVEGLPRGLAISAILSEAYLNRFDKAIASEGEIFFYTRYVDDILIVTGSQEDEVAFKKKVLNALPQGMHLNRGKSRAITIKSPTDKKTPDPAVRFEFLGYEIVVECSKEVVAYSKEKFRVVRYDLSLRKQFKIKTRIVKSILAYCYRNDFRLLRNRIAYLTGNFRIYDRDTCREKLAGIYYSYPQLSVDDGLHSLDKFLRACLFATTGRTFAKTISTLSPTQRRELARFPSLPICLTATPTLLIKEGALE